MYAVQHLVIEMGIPIFIRVRFHKLAVFLVVHYASDNGKLADIFVLPISLIVPNEKVN